MLQMNALAISKWPLASHYRTLFFTQSHPCLVLNEVSVTLEPPQCAPLFCDYWPPQWATLIISIQKPMTPKIMRWVKSRREDTRSTPDLLPLSCRLFISTDNFQPLSLTHLLLLHYTSRQHPFISDWIKLQAELITRTFSAIGSVFVKQMFLIFN